MKERCIFFRKTLPIVAIMMFFSMVFDVKAQDVPENIYFQKLNCRATVILDVLENETCASGEMEITIVAPYPDAAVSTDGQSITYAMPDPEFIGRDTIYYDIFCNGTLMAKYRLCLTVLRCPDNIYDLECGGEIDHEAFDFAIDRAWVSKQDSLCTYQTPLIGDLDGDGIPEIIVPKYKSHGVGSESRPGKRLFQDIYIYWGNDRENPQRLKTETGSFQSQALAMAKINVGTELSPIYEPIIVMLEVTTGRLTAYSPFPAKNTNPGAGGISNFWQAAPITGYNDNNINFLGFADFDNCGNPEIYCGNLIYDATNGTLLAEGGTGAGMTYGFSLWEGYNAYNSLAADVDNDGTPELVAGTNVYKVVIKDKTPHNNPTPSSQNSLVKSAGIPPVYIGGSGGVARPYVSDGFTTVADLTGDGFLDVIFVRSLYYPGGSTDGNANGPGDSCVLVAWSPKTETLLGKKVIHSHYGDFGVPFIANVDGDENPELEITFTTTRQYAATSSDKTGGRVEAYRLNAGNETFDRVYMAYTTDRSGTTGITAFDFNQDGKVELVYRDETDMRILNAVPSKTSDPWGTFEDVAKFPSFSNTGFEMAVVADADNDGSAEIIVVGGLVGSTAAVYRGSLQIFKSGNQYPWAPARRVWNQYMYNVVNINENLTVPKYSMSSAMIFPNGTQPYNAFLQQQSLLDMNYKPYARLPQVEWTSGYPVHETAGGKDSISSCITNTGTAALQAPIYVTFYKNNPLFKLNIIKVVALDTILLPGKSLCFKVSFEDAADYAPFTSIWISINDNNGDYPYQAECGTPDGRRKIEWEVNGPCDIAPPPATTPQTFCHGATVSNLQTHNGINIVWYDMEIGGTAYSPSDGLNNGVIYYAEQNIDGCGRERTAVKVFIDDDVFIDAPNMPGLLDICLPATLADVPTYGNTNLVWYDVPVGGTPLDPSAITLTEDVSYWVALNGGTNCNGEQRRTEVIITIAGETPEAPIMNDPQRFCEGVLFGNLETPNDQILWYETATGGEPLLVTDQPISGTYYAAQKVGSCESTRTPVEIILDHYPPPITLPTQTICGITNPRLSDLTITGAGIRWYNAPTGGTPLPLSTIISVGEEYWAAQESGICEGERTLVKITNICFNPYGTIFPFVRTGNETFDNQFTTTAKLFVAPPLNVIDKIGYVRKHLPIQTVLVTYYDCDVDEPIIGAPRDPGVVGSTNNPGLPIRWANHGTGSPATTTATDKCTNAPIGKYIFTDIAPGEYLLEISRQGFLVRYGVITVTGNNYLGHREILGGDLNGDILVTTQDFSAIRSKMSEYTTPNYHWRYDLDGSGSINSADINLIQLNLGLNINIYQETHDWEQ